jgi:hypothetical protein
VDQLAERAFAAIDLREQHLHLAGRIDHCSV